MQVITKSLDTDAIASATSVTMRQKPETNSANLRPEKIVCIGQAQSTKTVKTNNLYLASGNADDAGVIFGFGSPLHRMAMKLFPKAGNGSKVDTYFIAVPAPQTAKAEVKTLSVEVSEGGIKKSFSGFFRFRDLAFEAAADVAGKVATNAHNNPAKAPRGTDLNSYETSSVSFNFIKGMSAKEAALALIEALEEYVEIPFIIGKDNIDTGVLTLSAKWAGSDSFFEFNLIDSDGNEIELANHGIKFTTARTEEAAGVGKIPDEALDLLDEEFGVTRVVSQYATQEVLDKLQEKFKPYYDGLIAQYVICYTSIVAPESEDVSGTWDITSLIETGTKRREDSINVQIVGDYGNLRKLVYRERNRLLKAGYSNLVMKSNGTYRLMDLCTFYHPLGIKNPLFKFDRDVTVVANAAYDIMNYFRETQEWKSIIIISENDVTTNPAARTIKDVIAAVNSRIGLLGLAGLFADYSNAQKQTRAIIDENNPNRININPAFDITGVGRIYDFTNFVGFYFGT